MLYTSSLYFSALHFFLLLPILWLSIPKSTKLHKQEVIVAGGYHLVISFNLFFVDFVLVR